MQSVIRAFNIVLSPVFTLFFASRFSGVMIAGRDAGDVIGGAVTALLVLVVETALTQGPKYSTWLRRWLDPRAAFEGVWLQEVFEGQEDNKIGVFSVHYERERDSFAVSGRAYSGNGQQWAKFNSTHMFIDKGRLKATYLWEGQVRGPLPTPDAEKSGLTELELRRPPVLALPMTGDGQVSHVGENRLVKFRLHRLTKGVLKEHDLPFTVRKLRINAHDEEEELAKAFLQKRAVQQTKGNTTSRTDIR